MKLRKLVAILMVLSILMSIPVLNTFAADSFRTETVSDDGSEIDTDSEENSEATPDLSLMLRKQKGPKAQKTMKKILMLLPEQVIFRVQPAEWDLQAQNL